MKKYRYLITGWIALGILLIMPFATQPEKYYEIKGVVFETMTYAGDEDIGLVLVDTLNLKGYIKDGYAILPNDGWLSYNEDGELVLTR